MNPCIVILDLEATCWKKGQSRQKMEIIEIGAVRYFLQNGRWQQGEEFQQYIQPTENPILSDFCKKLTGINQETIGRSPYFPEGFYRFLKWFPFDCLAWFSWGDYDFHQFEIELKRHTLPHPIFLKRHLNLKKIFQLRFPMTKNPSMKKALEYLNIQALGKLHSGLDDAKNLGKIYLKDPGYFFSQVHDS